MEFRHKSVLLNETINGLSIKADGIYVDGTLGERDMLTRSPHALAKRGVL